MNIKNMLTIKGFLVAIALVGGLVAPSVVKAANPSISTIPAMVSGATVTFNGFINTQGQTYQKGFQWGPNTNSLSNTTALSNTTGSSSFSSSPVVISTPGTYYFRAVGFPVSGGTPLYGTAVSFTVTQAAVQNIAPIVNGNDVTLRGFSNIGTTGVQTFFKYGPTTAMTLSTNGTFQNGTPSFQSTVSNLTPGTYYVKAYAVYGGLPMYATGSMTFVIPEVQTSAQTVFNNNVSDRPTVRAMNFTQHGITTTCWTTSIPGSNNTCSNAILQAGNVVSMTIYYHNNGIAAATHTKLRVTSAQSLGASTMHNLSGSVSADNAPAVSGSANVSITSSQTLTFIPGSVKWYPNQSQTAQPLPNGQSESAIFAGGIDIGTIAQGWSTQGSIVLKFQVGQNIVTPISGCTNPTANNYNPNATVDNGSCTFTQTQVYGCTDPSATNYNPQATIGNGTCTYVQNPPQVYGCTIVSATNYNPQATVNNGSCVFPQTQIYGCTISGALNYNPQATINNGSCIFPVQPPQAIYGCTVASATNYNPQATVNNGSCVFPIVQPTTPTVTNTTVYVTSGNGTQYVSFSITPDYENVYVGDQTTFTVKYKNLTGTNLKQTIVRVLPPQEIALTRSTAGSIASDGALIVSLGTIGAHQSGSFTVTGTILKNATNRDLLVTTAKMSFATGTANTNHDVTAYATQNMSNNGSSNSNLAGLALFGSGGFLPGTLLGWLLLGLVIAILVLVTRKYFTKA